MTRKKAIRYARRLIGFESVSGNSNRMISKYLSMKLKKFGFTVERLDYRDRQKVHKVNLVAKLGSGSGGLALFGHTDTVPADRWFSRDVGPFHGLVRGGKLYGRGSCDMKGSIACMLSAVQNFSSETLRSPLYVVFTADEEVGYHGMAQVVRKSGFYREMVSGGTWAVIGEPTMMQVVHAHKATCGMTAKSRGTMGHSSTAVGESANWRMIPFLQEALAVRDETLSNPAWQDDRFDPPGLTMNLSISDSNRAFNVTAPRSICRILFRTLPDVSIDPLLHRLRAAAKRAGVKIRIDRRGEPFVTDPKSALVQTAMEVVGQSDAMTASYSTDGAMMGEMTNKIVLGPGNIAQAHTDSEWISLEQLERGTDVYTELIRRVCG